MKMKKMMIGFLLGIGLLAFASVSRAQDASENKKACDFLTANEVSSILGSSVQPTPFPGGDGCMYMGDPLATLMFSERDATNDMLQNGYQQMVLKQGAKPVDGMGQTALEKTDESGLAVWFFKNGVMGMVQVKTNQDQSSKTEALAKLIVSKL